MMPAQEPRHQLQPMLQWGRNDGKRKMAMPEAPVVCDIVTNDGYVGDGAILCL